MSSISISRLRDYCNEYLGMVFNAARTQLEIANAERQRDIISQLYCWLESCEDMRKMGKGNTEKAR